MGGPPRPPPRRAPSAGVAGDAVSVFGAAPGAPGAAVCCAWHNERPRKNNRTAPQVRLADFICVLYRGDEPNWRRWRWNLLAREAASGDSITAAVHALPQI